MGKDSKDEKNACSHDAKRILSHMMQEMLAHVMQENASLIGLELALVLETDPFSRVLVNKLKNIAKCHQALLSSHLNIF